MYWEWLAEMSQGEEEDIEISLLGLRRMQVFSGQRRVSELVKKDVQLPIGSLS